MRRLNRMVLPILLLTAGIGVTACGSSKKGTSSATTSAGAASSGSTTSSGSGATGKPILLGQIAPVGTPALNFSDMEAAAKAAVRGIDSRGGVGPEHRKLELLFCNEQNNANDAAACARSLISKGVVAFVSDLSVTGEAEIEAQTLKAHVVQVGDDGFSTFNSSSNNYPLNSANFAYYADVPACDAEKATKIAISGNGGSNDALESIFQSAIKSTPGLSVTSSATNISPTLTDVTSPVKTIIDHGSPNCMATIWYPAQTVLAVRAIAQFASPARVVGDAGGIGTPEATQMGGALLSAHYLSVGQFPQPGLNGAGYASMKQFVSDIKAEKAAGDSAAIVAPYVREEDIEAWAAVNAVAAVMKQTDSYTRQTLFKSFQTVKNVKYVDFEPPWTPSTLAPKSTGYLHRPAATTDYIYSFNSSGVPQLVKTLNILPLLPKQ